MLRFVQSRGYVMKAMKANRVYWMSLFSGMVPSAELRMRRKKLQAVFVQPDPVVMGYGFDVSNGCGEREGVLTHAVIEA
eukprot:5585222-Amphidinium_carterae.1